MRFKNRNLKTKVVRRINNEINSDSVRIVNKGEFPSLSDDKNEVDTKRRGIEIADDLGTDLIEISSQENVSICKLMDYDKFVYKEEKKQKEIKQNSQKHELKEIRMTPVIGENDYNVKMTQIKKFILLGDIVKVGIFFKGREISLLKEQGEKLLLQIADTLSDISRIKEMPKMEGKRMSIFLMPKQHK